jgi:Ca-activated chloride channel family protein
MGNYNDVLMEQLADRGDGRYAYLDSIEEARKVLVEDLTGTLQTLAREAKAQVEFHPEAVARYRLIGYENRDIPDERFRDDSVDAGEIGMGHAVTALYEVKLQPHVRRNELLATLRLRYEQVESGRVVEISAPLHAGDLAPSWERSSRAMKLGSLVAEWGEILKGSYWARQGDASEVARRLHRLVSRDYPGDREKAELVELVERAARLESVRSRERRGEEPR